MGKTSNKVKDKWNSANYTQIKAAVRPEIAATFKAACQANNVSMNSELSGFMENRCAALSASKPEKDLLANRGGRRKLLGVLMGQLERVKDAEEEYKENIPENLQGSVRYENAEQAIEALEEALEALYRVY